MMRVHNRVLKSRLPPCFFILIPLSRLFLCPHPDPAQSAKRPQILWGGALRDDTKNGCEAD